MPTFIDESGDTGPIEGGGKPYFRLAAVWVPTHDHAEAFRAAVRELRQTHGLRADYEFKFAGTHNYADRRRAFLLTALGHEFRFTVCAIDKTDSYWQSAPRAEMHWASAASLAVCLRPVYRRAEDLFGAPLREPVAVDRNDDGDFLDTVKRAFRGLKSRDQPQRRTDGRLPSPARSVFAKRTQSSA